MKKTWGKAGSKPIQKQEEQKPAEPISLKKATPIDKAPIEKTKVRMSYSEKIHLMSHTSYICTFDDSFFD